MIDLDEALAKHNERVQRARDARKQAREWIKMTQGWVGDVPLHVSELAQTLQSLLGQIEDYENGITWETTCTNCARMWDQNYAMHSAMEQIEEIAKKGRLPLNDQTASESSRG